MKNIALGETLEAISKKGSKEFYEGEIAKDIIETLNELGGVHTFEDFSKQSTISNLIIRVILFINALPMVLVLQY